MIAGNPVVLALLLLVALPLGLAITSGLLPARSRVGRAGTATLAGLGVLAAIAHALMCLGIPARAPVPILTGIGLVIGIWWLVRARRQRPPASAEAGAGGPTWRRVGIAVASEILPLALLAFMLFNDFHLVSNFAAHEHDTTRIWAQKAVRALDEAPPDLSDETVHAHPEYPRGLGLLTAAVSAPLGRLDPRLPRGVPLLLFALTLLCVFDALSARGNVAGAIAAMVILGSIPLVLRQAASGLADVPLSGFILLGSMGLASHKDGGPSIATTLAGALGAMVVKDEGVVFCGALVLVLAFRLLRSRRPLPAMTAVALTALLAAPWIVLRSKPHTGVPFLWRSALENFGLVLIRFDKMIREVAHLALGFPDPSLGGFTLADVMPGGDLVLQTAVVCALVLIIGRGGHFPVLPVGLLLLGDFVAILMSHVEVDWQLVTATNRLVLQCLPVLLVAAVDKLTHPTKRPIPLITLEARAAAGE